MHITFRQMRLFLALADSGSVGAAARAMHVTQPTASMQLKEVTDSVGVPLYEVVSKKVFLTDAGRDLAHTARQIAHTWDAFTQKVDGTRGLTRGTLRVAVVSTAKHFVPRVLGTFCAAHPGVDIALEILNRDAVVTRLRDNRDDLYIMSMPPKDMALADTILMPNPLVLIAAPSHPLAQRKRLALRALADMPFILREAGSGTRMAIDAHFRRLRFKAHVRLALGSNEAVRESVAAGLGIGVLSRHALAALAQPNVVELPVQGFPVQSQWHVVHPKGKQLSPIAREFHRHLQLAVARGDT